MLNLSSSQSHGHTDCWSARGSHRAGSCDVIKWKHFPCYWPLLRGIHRSLVNSPHKDQWRRAWVFSLILCLNNRLGKQSWGWWFETPSCSLWRQCNFKYNLDWNKYRWYTNRYTNIKRRFRYFDNIFITGGINSCHFDNLGCILGWKFRQNDIRFCDRVGSIFN